MGAFIKYVHPKWGGGLRVGDKRTYFMDAPYWKMSISTGFILDVVLEIAIAVHGTLI